MRIDLDGIVRMRIMRLPIIITATKMTQQDGLRILRGSVLSIIF